MAPIRATLTLDWQFTGVDVLNKRTWRAVSGTTSLSIIEWQSAPLAPVRYIIEVSTPVPGRDPSSIAANSFRREVLSLDEAKRLGDAQAAAHQEWLNRYHPGSNAGGTN